MRRSWWMLILLLVAWPGVAHAAPTFDEMRSSGWMWAYFGVFAAGLLTSLTPCVYPMIPIVVGIFGAKKAKTKLQAFSIAWMYVLGMGVMYAGLGTIVALTGRAFGEVLALWYVVIPLVLLYGTLAASMFGLFEIQLPPALQAKLSSVGGRGHKGAFLMGTVGGLTAAPCTGPILAGILAFVATTKNVALGTSLLFTYALGMGVLFLLLATFAMRLPKSGAWMDVVKAVGGIALLVVGVYFLRPIWPMLRRVVSTSPAFVGGASALAVAGLAIAVLGFYKARHHAVKGAGIALAVIGLSGLVNYSLTPKNPLPWRHDHAVALAEARAAKRPVLLDFSAEWCEPCKKYETNVFSDSVVYDEITTRFVAVKIDMTSPGQAEFDAKKTWEAAGLPTVIIIGADGEELERFEGTEVPSVTTFLAALRDVP